MSSRSWAPGIPMSRTHDRVTRPWGVRILQQETENVAEASRTNHSRDWPRSFDAVLRRVVTFSPQSRISCMRDVRFAARQLRNSPGFSLTVLLTLGICIGANTAIYSIVDAVLLRPVPYPHPDRLGMVGFTARSSRGEYTVEGQNGAMWEGIRDNATAVDAAAFSGGAHGVNLFVNGSVLFIEQQRVSAGFFHVLGVAPLIGREFSRAEDTDGGAQVAILSYPLWQRLYRGDDGAVGKPILLKGELHTVIAVSTDRLPDDRNSSNERKHT